ncbi:MAG: FAD-dependent oxidoreductase [Bacilli bacterium]|nr:FAD-dependent oxidoreductase [Bacilli bacterium]
MSASLNMLRYGKKVLLLEKENIGGQIASAPNVENLPSLKSISGMDFSNNFFSQLLSLNICFKFENVLSVKKEEKKFLVTTNAAKYFGKAIIIAVGVKAKKIDIDNEKQLVGHGISYCAICDGIFFKNKDVCVIGDGNTALQYALFLSSYCKNVFLCTLTDKLFADDILVNRIKNKSNIFLKNYFLIKEVFSDAETKFLKKIDFVNLLNKKQETINAQGLFIAIGQAPKNEIFENLVSLENGFIDVDKTMQTKTQGVFAVGDCINKQVRQVSTAVSDGSIAAFFANKYLENLG